WLARCGDGEAAVEDFQKAALLAHDEAPRLRIREILARLCVRLQTRPVILVVRQRIERDQAPRFVVRSLVGQEISDEMAAAARNNADPVCRIFLERGALRGLD